MTNFFVKDLGELLKPITWFPPMWAFACGAVASGSSFKDHIGLIVLGLLLTGPLVCASSQAVNDWFDREVDAINEPDRPIPSGRIPGNLGLKIAIVWSLLSICVSTLLGYWGLIATILAVLLAWAYSMPPIRLKNNGWLGNAACGFSYEGLAWITGAIVMTNGTLPPWETISLAILYSICAHGIMTLNDFKSISGDKQFGVNSLPVKLGVNLAAKLACLTMLVPQCVVVLLLFLWSANGFGLTLMGLIFLQIGLMLNFLKDPVKRALFYSAAGVPILVGGMMLSAVALRNLDNYKPEFVL
jgi:chlorophyll synthase